MTTSPEAPFTLFGFIKRISGQHNGALIVISAPPSFGLTEMLDALILDIPIKTLILPALVAFSVILGYFIMFTIDFAYGLYAAKKAAGKGNEYFESDKAYSSIFKMFAVVSLIFFLSLFSIIAAVANWETLSKIFIILSAGIGIMAMLFDFSSIGENYKKINGNQARIFIWLRNITEIIDEGLTSKIKAFFGNINKPVA